MLKFLLQDSESNTALEQFAEQHGVKIKPLRNMVRGILFFFNEALKKNLGQLQVQEDLVKLGSLFVAICGNLP